MNAFCQLRLMLGYSDFLSKLISYFSIYDVDFYCFIVFAQFQYKLIKTRLPETIFSFRKGRNQKVCNF